jgi:hypothetical protein
MKLRIKTTFDRAEIDSMLERYFEGLTSVEEEKQLYRWLSHPSLKGEYSAERAMLGYFKESKSSVQLVAMRWIKQVAVVAVLVVSGFAAIQLFTPPVQASYAYVNGTKITNPEQVRSKAMASVSGLPSSDALVDENLKNVSSKELIESQLDIFAGME